ncbi:asparagine synthase [Pseudoalteromonas piscicida]|uniref:asparagine synthase (glutamine-hydrolyzing) n=1 Tax=Pseudoalteromonas piscicida TaxID=43662 RepID=A0AAQ2EWN6_PSEO7|nr:MULTISPECIES: asparagine synthase C-terminal domain-containing protein [Pseudoalteromonas]KJY90469.1 hypothetical protein TW75_07490 [Pseudoalteromonas piscicida]TMN43933.1 asparagine synthase [Pseudoalteromonas piscicida]TMN44166.1 asparagine synthase [Pseudoalteromonas piscicida]TMN49698.1 asparagine synthase [Pseudoalteromonas piscicida]TMN57538.1 asparagine synthase [Pseudoalteromonas piscicida]
MDLQFDLSCSDGFSWYESSNFSVKGYAFYRGKLYQHEFLVELFNKIESIEDVKSIAMELNGFFSVVIRAQDSVYLISDKLRSFPLFYTLSKDKIIIKDKVKISPKHIVEKGVELDSFRLSGFTIGSKTLLKNIEQVEPCQIIEIKNAKVSKHKYFSHSRSTPIERDEGDEFENLLNISNNVARRLAKSLAGKLAVIPLSGGYDSRYILCMLLEMGVRNILCYTYGNDNSFEVKTARSVCNKLGVQLVVIKYSPEKWVNLLDDHEFTNYIDFSFNYSSLPHIQDFIALRELKSLGVLSENSVFIPGFCGDLLGGSYIPKEVIDNKVEYLSLNDEEEYILNKQFSNVSGGGFDLVGIKSEISKVIKRGNGTLNSLISNNELFLTEHKCSKFVVNSLRVYEYFGYEWRMPLWDDELISYWYRVDNKKRIRSELYNSFLLDMYFAKYGVDIKKKVGLPSNQYVLKLRRVIPNKLLAFLRVKYLYIYKKLGKGDVNDFNSFESALLDGSLIYKVNNVNGALAFWVLKKVTCK